MKKLLAIASLAFAFSPLANAQNGNAGIPGHPDARNDRPAVAAEARSTTPAKQHAAKKHHAKKSHRHAKHHQQASK